MAKDRRYKTIYFPDDDKLFSYVEKWMQNNDVKAFNTAILKLVALGLGDQEASLLERMEKIEKSLASVLRLLKQQGIEL